MGCSEVFVFVPVTSSGLVFRSFANARGSRKSPWMQEEVPLLHIHLSTRWVYLRLLFFCPPLEFYWPCGKIFPYRGRVQTTNSIRNPVRGQPAMKRNESMQILKYTAIPAALGCAMVLLGGCQCCPPVRECVTVTRHEPCAPCLTTRSTPVSQECPDGIHRLAGAPLYYESQNLNWEQAPPFGRW